MTRQSITRIRSYGDFTISGTAAKQIIYVAEQNCTIRRVIANIAYTKENSVSNETAASFAITTEPAGNQVVPALGTLGSNGDVMPYEYIMGGLTTSYDTNQYDSKGMRKLRKGDEVVLEAVVHVDSGTTINSSIFYYVDIFIGE